MKAVIVEGNFRPQGPLLLLVETNGRWELSTLVMTAEPCLPLRSIWRLLSSEPISGDHLLQASQ